jgi:two-component system catabolic regulation response regulator CreB
LRKINTVEYPRVGNDMAHILIVEDESSIADTLLFALQADGQQCTWLQLAREAVAQIQHQTIDLVILDVGLPDINGFEACKLIRQHSDVPILFLTARDSEIDRIVGLEIGADDYVTKPFSPREVAARVRAILKRTSNGNSSKVSAAQFQIDKARLRISYRQQALNLTHHEYQLLEQLLEHPDQVLSREQLLKSVGIATEAGYERNVDTHIKSLRAKLRAIAPDADPILTHRGVGYCYSPEHA